MATLRQALRRLSPPNNAYRKQKITHGLRPMHYSSLTVHQPATTRSPLLRQRRFFAGSGAGAGSLKTVTSPLPVRRCIGEPPESNQGSHSGRGIARARKGRAPDFRVAPAVRCSRESERRTSHEGGHTPPPAFRRPRPGAVTAAGSSLADPINSTAHLPQFGGIGPTVICGSSRAVSLIRAIHNEQQRLRKLGSETGRSRRQ
jgi:hypothetical protein